MSFGAAHLPRGAREKERTKENGMVSKEEIVEKLNALQQAKAKAKVYEDVIASVAKYEATLERKHSDAKKRCERLGKADKSSQAYMSAINDSVMLRFQIVEAKKMHSALLEVSVEVCMAQGDALAELSKAVDEE